MNITDYKAALDEKLEDASSEAVSLTIKEMGGGETLHIFVIDADLSVIAGPPDEDVMLVMLIAQMTPDAAAKGVCAACCAIDALALGNVDWRNGILERLHVFDGKFANGIRHATQARGWEFAAQVNHPAMGLMSYTIKKL